MYSEFNSFSFTGVSDSGLFLSKKDLNAMESNSLSRPTSEIQVGCQIAPSKDGDLQEQDQGKNRQQKDEKGEIIISSLRIKTQSLGEFKNDDNNDGIRTPTSLDQRIPLILQCPPAPRKPKSLPLTKRKAASRRILLDLSSEVESLFPQSVLADLGGKINKVRKVNCTK